MTTKQAITILDLHNQWRKGANIEMQKPSEITEAIDKVVEVLKGVKNNSKGKKDEK